MEGHVKRTCSVISRLFWHVSFRSSRIFHLVAKSSRSDACCGKQNIVGIERPSKGLGRRTLGISVNHDMIILACTIIIIVRIAAFLPFGRIACIPRHSQTFGGEILLRPAIGVGVAGSVASTESTSHLHTKHSASTFSTSSAIGGSSALRLSLLLPSHHCHGFAANTCTSPVVKRSRPAATRHHRLRQLLSLGHIASSPPQRQTAPSSRQPGTCSTRGFCFILILCEPLHRRDRVSQRRLPAPKR